MRSVAVIVAGILLAATGEPPRAEKRDEITIGMTQFPATLNPIINAMLAKSYALAMVLRPLTAYDSHWEPACLLCTEVPTVENGLAKVKEYPDGSEGIAVSFTIRPGATWGDGTPVTSRDAVFGWEVGSHPLTGVADRQAYTRIRDVEIQDEKRFTVHLDQRYYDYNIRASTPLLPAHLESEAFADPREYRFRTTYDTDSTNPGLYFGPYLISEVEPGSHIVFERNPTWWGEPAYFRRIVIRVIENTAALEANLLSGAVDYVAGELGFSLDQALSFERRHSEKFTFVYKPGLFYEHIDINLDNPIVQDKRVRQALLQALDRELLVTQLFGGHQPVAHSNVNPLDRVYAADTKTYPYDPDRAAALLDEAGWTRAGKSTRTNDRGERLTLQLMSTAGNKARELVQQVLQSQWGAVGIDVTIKNEPARVFFGQTMAHRAFSALGMYAWLSAPESVPRSTLHSESIPTAENNWSGQNTPGFVSAEMDSLIDQAEVELDRNARKTLWRRMQEIYAEELPVLPLYFRAQPYILPKWLKGIEPTGHLGTTTLWVENWRAGD